MAHLYSTENLLFAQVGSAVIQSFHIITPNSVLNTGNLN